MPTFLVHARETMDTTYLVRAHSANHAREKVEQLGINDHLDQIDASVFEVEALSVELQQPQQT